MRSDQNGLGFTLFCWRGTGVVENPPAPGLLVPPPKPGAEDPPPIGGSDNCGAVRGVTHSPFCGICPGGHFNFVLGGASVPEGARSFLVSISVPEGGVRDSGFDGVGRVSRLR